ncbi:MAG: MucR family transcriptional regulator [Alphaproteobacteria bacterium]|nr:MucR family transcriptional regulator [Alphaproteobacteria bacterium]
MTDDRKHRTLRELTAGIAASYIAGHPTAAADLPRVIQSIHASLAALDSSTAVIVGTSAPAVPVKRSIGADHLVCLGCGIVLKTLKRHLRAVHQMTPQQYRDTWNLSPTYPMVAPSYATQRSRHAKAMGLGKRTNKKR